MSDKKRKVLLYIFLSLSILMSGFLIFQSALPANSSMRWSNVATDVAKDILPSHVDADGSIVIWDNVNGSDFVRKLIGHFSFYLIDGVFISLYLFYQFYFRKDKKLPLILLAIIGLFLSALTEFIQLFVPGRAGDIIDILINFGGFILGSGLVILVIFIITYRKNKKTV